MAAAWPLIFEEVYRSTLTKGMRLSPLNRTIFSLITDHRQFSGGEQRDFMRPGRSARRGFSPKSGTKSAASLSDSARGVAGMYRTLYESGFMTKETTYTFARGTLALLCDEVAETRKPFIIRRRGARDVALIAADELESLIETAHLLRPPKNAQRLLAAFQRARSKKLKAPEQAAPYPAFPTLCAEPSKVS